MDTIPTTAQGVGSDNLKEEDGSSLHADRASPPPNCSICLGKCKNKCFTDSCFHQFCFKCLLRWSQIKAECPLCKQNFKSIIHNVRSNHQYDEYTVEQAPPPAENEVFEAPFFDSPRFRYRTTFTLHRRDSLAIQRILHHLPPSVDALPRVLSPTGGSRSTHRRSIYRLNLRAVALPDITGRYRECSPEFYRCNPAQIHRLVPWLHRELMVLLNDPTRVAYVLRLITDTLPIYPIHSSAFKIVLMPYLGSRLGHFLHEFTSFATSPFDMVGYDRTVRYHTTPVMPMYNSVLNSDSDNSNDSDIVLVTSTPGPSEPSNAAGTHTDNQENATPQASHLSLDNVIAIETISHSDTDDSSSEVMVVGYIKPPQDRTPEVVDLLASDSDVILNEPEPEPPGIDRSSSDVEIRNSDATPSFVKVKLKRTLPSASSSDWGEGTSHCRNRAACKRRKVRDSASTSSTVGDTSDDLFCLSDTNLSHSDSDNSWLEKSAFKKSGHVVKKRPKLKNRRVHLDTSDSSLDGEVSCSDASSNEPLPKKLHSKCSNRTVSSNRNRKNRRPRTSEVLKRKEKALKKSRSHSRESVSAKKKLRPVKRKPREHKTNSRSNKAKARTIDQIKSSQKRFPGKKRSNVIADLSLRTEERPSTSAVADAAYVVAENENSEANGKKRLKSVVNVVDGSCGADGPANANSDESQTSKRNEGATLLDLMNNAVLSNSSNVLSYNSDSGSCALSEDVPLKYLFPTINDDPSRDAAASS